MSRGQRLLKRALNRSGLSPEDFVQLHPGAVGNYSARTVRRWLASNKIPPFVIPYLQVFLADK